MSKQSAESAVDGLLEAYEKYCRFGETSASAAALGMTSRNFAKLLKDCGLVGKALSLTSVDLSFTKAKASAHAGAHDWSSKRLSFENFLVALDLCADEAKTTPEALHTAILAHAGGPLVQATVAEPSRFHDDKNTYTANLRGSHKPLSRRDSALALPAPTQPRDRAALEAVYTAFARFGESQSDRGAPPGLTNRNLVKLFRDCGLEGGQVTPTLIDLAFARAARHATSVLAAGPTNRLSFEAFLIALQIVAEADGARDAHALHARIVEAGEPSVSHATVSAPNKFFDAAAPPRALARMSSASRASRAALEITSLPMGTVPANQHEVAQVFEWYCRFGENGATAAGPAPGLSNRNLVKLFRDARLDGRGGVSSQVIDTLFAKARLAPPCVEGGAKRLSYEQFLVLLELVTDETGASIDALHAAVGSIAHAGGPIVHATVAAPNRFHDDKSKPRALSRADSALSLPTPTRPHDDDALRRVFSAYARFGESGAAAAAVPGLLGRNLQKMCKEAGLLGGGRGESSAAAVDLAFTKASRAPTSYGGAEPSNRLSYDQFLIALELIAADATRDAADVQRAVMRTLGEGASGPIAHATVAEPNRFHDDKSTYTANLRGGAAPKLGRRDSAAQLLPIAPPPDARVEAAFAAYASFGEAPAASGALALSSRNLIKLFKDCALLSARLPPASLDVAFSKARNAPEAAGSAGAGGAKPTKLSYAQFVHAVHLCALELAEPVESLFAAIGERGAAGPVVVATVSPANKFYDDPKLLTASAASLRSDGAERRLSREPATPPPRRPSLGASGAAVAAVGAFNRSASPLNRSASPLRGGRAGSASRRRSESQPGRIPTRSSLDVGFSNMRVAGR